MYCLLQRLKHGLLIGCAFLFLTLSASAQIDVQKTRMKLDADTKVKTYDINNKLGTASFISFNEKAGYKTADAVQVLKQYFELEAAGNDIVSFQKTDANAQLKVERFKQTYQGVPVEHSSYVMISKGDKIISVAAESYALSADFSTTPVLTKEAALEKALAFVGATKYAWDALEEDKVKMAGNFLLQQKLESLRQEYLPKGELVIAKDVYGNGQAKLAWKYNIYATEPLGRYNIYIDAKNGQLLLRDMIIKHAGEVKEKKPVEQTVQLETPHHFTGYFKNTGAGEPNRTNVSEIGQAHTRYAGVRSIYTTRITVPLGGTPDPNNTSVQLSYSGVDPRSTILLPEQVFVLKDDTRGNGVETYDMNAAGGAPLSLPGLHANSLAFVDRNVTVGSQNIWRNETATSTNEDHVRGATSNGSVGADEAANDDYALDAHWGAEMVYDYWKIVHNRFSYDNVNSPIKSYVHYGPAYDNAFWNGSVMTYGDGSGTSANGFKPLTSLDVCGHEIGHGVCSFTSDLVYESESGAMNEALSDIWAAAIERYVIVNIDPSLSTIYKPFSIGEQIAANPAAPLRRMDNPKARTDPDTYGGQYWVNPVCTPTLANDQCGVHTNSGILNKWFYLLTAGSGAGSGPDAAYAVPGADDGLRDNPGPPVVFNSVPYSVTGIGFDKAEAITYMMELTLTPNATFAQARTASINAARILYGECSMEEISTTNAWFAINVGAAYTSCALPTISASVLSTNLRETAGGLDCDRYNDYSVNVNLTSAQASATTVNFSIGSTNMSADEYSLSATSVTYNIGETGLKSVKLRIYDDAMVELDENITVNVSCSSPALNQSFNFVIKNDDLDPIIGATQTLLQQNFESFPIGPFTTTLSPNAFVRIDKLAPSPVQWSNRSGSGGSLPQFATARAIIELPLVPGQALYDQVAEANTILRFPMINANGLNTINVKFTYQAGGEPACSPACDYGQLLYSFDGNNFSAFADLQPFFLSPSDAQFEYTLPASFNGKQFYLGLQWYNDANAGTSGSVTIDNIMVTAKGRGIENSLGASVSEKFNGEVSNSSYFYSTTDGEIIARIANNSLHNFGCTAANIEKAGNAAFELYNDGTNSHRVADKIIRITPTVNNTGSTYNISFYFTEQQILALEAFTSLTRNNFFIYKTTAGNYTGATPANTVRVAATYESIPGFGGKFTALFGSAGFSAFALGASVSVVLPVNCLEFRGTKTNSGVQLAWKVSEDRDNAYFEIERSFDGVNYFVINNITANSINGGQYRMDDNSTAGYSTVYYRIKQVDRNGVSRYICNTLKIKLTDAVLTIGKVHPNPAADNAFVNVITDKAMKMRMEYVNAVGQLVFTQAEQLQPGTTIVPLQLKNVAAGTYLIRFSNEKGELLDTQIYIRN